MGVVGMTRITLPWPAKELSPNARGHWAKMARFKKGAREHAHWVAKKEGWWTVGENYYIDSKTGHYEVSPLVITITFCPPDNRRRDLDNAIASFKSAQDGIADALGIDDSRWSVSYAWGDVVKGGRVVVELDA
jgi:crossover junction endodeoxyribonuclease RusA